MVSLFIVTGIAIMLFHSYLQSENRYKIVFLADEIKEANSNIEGQDPGISLNQIIEYGKQIKNEAFNIFLCLFLFCLIIPGLVLSSGVKL